MSQFLPLPTIRFPRIAPRLVVAIVLAFATASCLAPGARDEAAELEAQSRMSDIVPSFAPDATAAPSSDAASQAPAQEEPSPDAPASDDPASDDDTEQTEDGDQAESPTSEKPSPSPAASEPTTVLASSVDDAEGDVTPSALDETPAYADLLEGHVTLRDARYEIRVTMAADVPEQQPDPDRTMNVAWFADLDGDGVVDHEIWVNLADNGWFPGHRDNRRREARFGDETGIEVTVDGRDLVLRFSSDLIRADSFRWAIASEWGRYEVLGTDAAARDSAPEDHGSVDHPA